MKSFKFFILIALFLFVLTSVSCFPIGVIEPEMVCAKPNTTGAILVDCYSGSEGVQEYEISVDNQTLFSLENDSYWFLSVSRRDIPVFFNTTGIEQGVYTGNFVFCPIGLIDDGAMGVTYCISSLIQLNVSENCPDLPEPVIEEVVLVEDNLFLGLIEFETFRTAFTYFALFLVVIIFTYLLNKRNKKKRNKK